jgi:hypothetical protein
LHRSRAELLFFVFVQLGVVFVQASVHCRL